MPNQKSPDLVLVEWIDAAHYDGWQFGANPENLFESCWTVGFLLKSSKEGVLIAQTWYPGDTANLIQIPAGMIKKKTILGDLNFG